MTRLLTLVFMLVTCQIASSNNVPSFLQNKNVVYGIGISSDQEEADNYALLSLAKAIRSSVASKSTYTVSATKTSITNEVFNKEASVTSDIILNDAAAFLDFDGEKFTAYRYINKEEYISEHIAEFTKWIKIAESYSSKDSARVKHRQNLVLGAYYMAYKSMDTDIMGIIYPQAESNKKMAFNAAKEYYNRTGGAPCIHTIKWYGLIIASANHNVGVELDGFEVLGADGTWIEPSSVSDTEAMYCPLTSQYLSSVKCYFAVVNRPKSDTRTKLPYRFTYEICQNGVISKIEVEEEWFFIKNFMFTNYAN